MREIVATTQHVIPLGKRGENNAEVVKFPINGWADVYGAGAFELINVRPNETTPYTCAITQDNEFVYWTVQPSDLAIVGDGKCELTYVADGVIAKSLTFETRVFESLDDSGELPPPYEARIDQIIEASANVTVKAQQVDEDAQQASEDANAAEENRKKSEGYATGTENGVPVPISSPYHNNNAKYYAQQIGDGGLKAEGYAVGKQNGTDVPSGSPYFHNNAKYFAGIAGDYANAADTWLEENVSQETGYVLDRSLSLQNAAAPADIVLHKDYANAFINNSRSANFITLPDAAGDVPFRSLELTYDYVEGGISTAQVYVTGKNLFGGKVLRDNIKAAVPSATIDAENKTISFAGSAGGGKAFLRATFKENTQYTIILYGRNLKGTGSVYTNITFYYTDGTNASNQIRFSAAGEDSYAVYTSAQNKTIRSIAGLFVESTTLLYYDKCGLFEGAATADDFEDYIGKKVEADLETQIGTIYGGTVDFATGRVISTKESDGTDLEEPVEYHIVAQNVLALYGLNNILTPADSVYAKYCVDTKMYVGELAYDPDYFDGTDSEKLQQCFDALNDVGGNIFIKRTFTLSENLIIRNNSDRQRFIRVFGMGENAKINCGSYRITAPTTGGHAFGGVFWFDMAFDGSSIGFDAGVLIRMWFFQCAFKGFSRAFSADETEAASGETRRYIHTLYLSQCEIKGCNTGIYIRGGAYNLGLHQCLIENVSFGINNYSGSLMGVRIYDCVIEAVWDTGIRVNGNGASLTIDNNYFEAIPQSIYFSDSASHRAISVRNNYFVQNNKSAIFIKPSSTLYADRIKGVIDGNTHLNSDGDQAIIRFTTEPIVPQPWRIVDNYPNRVDNAGRFAVGSSEALASENVLDPENADYKDLLDGVYTVDGENEIIQVISSGNTRVQVRFKNDGNNTTLSFRIQDIANNTWSEWT